MRVVLILPSYLNHIETSKMHQDIFCYRPEITLIVVLTKLPGLFWVYLIFNALISPFFQQSGLLLALFIQFGGLEWVSGVRPGCLVSKHTILNLL